MAQKILVMGESGTGKSTSLRNCDPATTAVVNPVGKPLPFKGAGKFETLDNETDARKICKWMKEQVSAGKKLIVVDDFQYILAVPYMNRIKEAGWDKWNDFGSNYYEIIEVCKDLPDDVVVAYMTHTETLDNGVTTIKLIGKMLREKITIEGLFTVVLRTLVSEGSYYFVTQNNGKDTVKSPLGMFPAYTIDNDMKYVADKMRNYYEVGDYVSDADMAAADQAVAGGVEKPEGRRRGKTSSTATDETAAPAGGGRRRSKKEVEASNKEKMDQYMDDCGKAVDEVAGEREAVPFDEAADAIDKVPKPDVEKVPRRTRAERLEDTGTDNTDAETVVLKEDTYFHVIADDNYIMKHAGDSVDLIVGGERIMEQITKEEFGAGVKRLAQQDNPVAGAMNEPEPSTRPRRTRRNKAN